jgi:thiosulfate dehydrogenase [quinone] large subunit
MADIKEQRPVPSVTERWTARHRDSLPDSSEAHVFGVEYLLGALRIAVGWLALWAFLDKTFGLGHDTTPARSWLNGGSPTRAFLAAARGPLSGFYRAVAGSPMTDALVMASLLAIGTALVLGVAVRAAAVAGAVLSVLAWSVVLPPAGDPLVDDHLIAAMVLVLLALLGAGDTLGLGRTWADTSLARRFPWFG